MKNNFPKWAPKAVIAEWQEKMDEAKESHSRFLQLEMDTSEANIYYRLLTYEDMKSVWERLPKYDIKPALFSSMVAVANHYPDYSPSNKTPKEHEIWLNDVKATALKLAELVKFSEFDRILDEKYYTKRMPHMLKDIVKHSFKILKPEVDENNLGEPEHKRWPALQPGLLSDNLYHLAKLNCEDEVGLLGIKRDRTILLDKPNHKNAARTYFMKKLTEMLRDKTGGKPLRDIVTKTTATVFNDPAITERQIIRAAP